VLLALSLEFFLFFLPQQKIAELHNIVIIYTVDFSLLFCCVLELKTLFVVSHWTESYAHCVFSFG